MDQEGLGSRSDVDSPIDDLDLLGAMEGTDKSSSWRWAWDYLRHYQRHFTEFRMEPINLIEIGVLGGDSLRMWRAWFPHATIVGVDIVPECRRHAGDRVHIEIGSQDDPAFLAELVRKYPPSIVIDDGSHLANHVVFTFERLFPSLLPGGIYVVEDTAFHFGAQAEHHRGAGGYSVPAYFSRIFETCMARSLQRADDCGMPRFLADQIDSVTAIPGALLLRRKGPIHVAADAMRLAEAYQGGSPRRVARLIPYFVLRNDLPGAEAVARRAAELGVSMHDFAREMAELRERQGRVAEAADLLWEAAQQWANDVDLWSRTASFAERAGQHERAELAYRRLMALNPSHPGYADQLINLLDRQNKLQNAIIVAQNGLDLAADEPRRRRFQARLAQLRAKAA